MTLLGCRPAPTRPPGSARTDTPGASPAFAGWDPPSPRKSWEAWTRAFILSPSSLAEPAAPDRLPLVETSERVGSVPNRRDRNGSFRPRLANEIARRGDLRVAGAGQGPVGHQELGPREGREPQKTGDEQRAAERARCQEVSVDEYYINP